MSFLDDLKKQIVSQPYKSACCKRAMLNGIIFAKGKIENGEIDVFLENSDAINYTSVLIKEFFGKDARLSSAAKGGRVSVLSFKSPAALKYLDAAADISAPLFASKCPSCESAFLRGVFLSCGRMTDPRKQYRIEFAPLSNIVHLGALLSDLGIKFSEASRRGEHILYTGNSGVAEDFFAAIGMTSVTFMLMNSKIEGEFKSTANRIRNCETNNIQKTVSASARCVEAIEALEKANLLSTLPEELEKTARLRLEFKDYSLSRLAAEFTPPISKPGLSHRLNKIVDIAENLLGTK